MGYEVFKVEQLERAGEIPQLPGRAGWYVDLPGISYRGKVTAPADWSADQVLEALNRFAEPLGERIAWSRLYTPVPVDDH